jgi:hypothetical protein
VKARWLDLVIAGVVAALVSIPVRGAGDSLTAARAMYAAAEYEDALAALNRLQETADRPLEEKRAIAQYRAYCFLALGRAADAEAAIAVVVSSTPRYLPSEDDASPRVRAAFRDVRRRMLPIIIQERYQEAKAALDQKEFAVAAAGFREVVDAMGDPDAVPYFSEPPHSDLRTLAIGFRELSAMAIVPPPLTARPMAPEAKEPVVAPGVAAPAVVAPVAATPVVAVPAFPAQKRVFGAGDLNVIPPVVLRQMVPPLQVPLGLVSQGVLEVLIDETGHVEQARLHDSVSVAYDKALLDATRQWLYKPATFLVTPVKYRRMIQISPKR